MGGREGREAHAERLRSVREATGLTQLQFLERLNREAEALGSRGYVQSLLSRLENGLQVPSFDDIAVYAAIDPDRRGKLWLGWGEAVDATLAAPGQPIARGVVSPELVEAVRRKPAADAVDPPARHAAGDRQRRGRRPGTK